MDFVYVCRSGENEELRYSIRSVVSNYPESSIWLFGGKPAWYKGNYIHVQDIGNKFKNITECYKEISKTKQLSDFVLMNDDFFILNQSKINYFYDGTLKEKYESHGSIHGTTEYFRVLSYANRFLEQRGISNALNYDTHTPMIMNREKLSEIVGFSNAPRSVYGNMFNVGGIKIDDVKVYKSTKNIIAGDFISTEDNSFKTVYDLILKQKFTEKTKYED